MESTTEFVLIEQHGAILRIQFNRPEKKNAILPDMYNNITKALKWADENPEIRVIFITGTGNGFSAGNDISTFVGSADVFTSVTDSPAFTFIKTISKTQTPIVAAVNGFGVGVGLTMLLHCDLVYAVPEAVFNFAFIDLGLVPEAASTYLAPHLMGHRRAAEFLLLGDKFDAATALEVGILNEIVDSEELEAVAWAKAEKLASKPPEALRLTKQLLKRGNAATVDETMDHEFGFFAERLQSDEVQQIMQAFFSRKN